VHSEAILYVFSRTNKQFQSLYMTCLS